MKEINLEIIYKFINHLELKDQTMHLRTYVNDSLSLPIYSYIYKNNKYYSHEYESVFNNILKLHFNGLTEIISIKAL